jgi:hypothetical protein
VSAALRPDALPGGYVNLLGPDETEEAEAAYGPNRDRLVAIKDRVDPDGVFAATPFPTAARSSLPDEGLPALDRIAPAGA